MATLTLDKSRKALAVLAWRKGMTKKKVPSLAKVHEQARNKANGGKVHVRGLGPNSYGLTAAQAHGVKKRK